MLTEESSSVIPVSEVKSGLSPKWDPVETALSNSGQV